MCYCYFSYCYLLINWNHVMHNEYVFIFLLTFLFWFSFVFFLFVLNALLQRDKGFLFYKRRKCIRQRQLNDIMSRNQLKMNWKWTFVYKQFIWIPYKESKLMFGKTLRKRFWFFLFFCGIVKLICRVRHTFFVNLRLQQGLWFCFIKTFFCCRQICSFCDSLQQPYVFAFWC